VGLSYIALARGNRQQAGQHAWDAIAVARAAGAIRFSRTLKKHLPRRDPDRWRCSHAETSADPNGRRHWG
jgi:hypothetical protein